jgi:hypothetical protein
MIPPPLAYTEEHSDIARRRWKASCGPHAIAAATGLSLEAVRPHLPDFRGWMSPTQITGTLASLKIDHELVKGLRTKDLEDGILRVQFEGPWLNPGVPARVGYFHTHYIAVRGAGVLDTMCLPAEWYPRTAWARLADIVIEPPDTGWHFTHVWRFAHPKTADTLPA